MSYYYDGRGLPKAKVEMECLLVYAIRMFIINFILILIYIICELHSPPYCRFHPVDGVTYLQSVHVASSHSK